MHTFNFTFAIGLLLPPPQTLLFPVCIWSTIYWLSCCLSCSRDRYGIATKKDKILCIFMIVLAVFSNVVAIYSDAYALIKKSSSPREWFLMLSASNNEMEPSVALSGKIDWWQDHHGTRECISLRLLVRDLIKFVCTTWYQNLSRSAQDVSNLGVHVPSSFRLYYINYICKVEWENRESATWLCLSFVLVYIGFFFFFMHWYPLVWWLMEFTW